MIKDVYFLDYYNNLIVGNREKCKSIVEELLSHKTDVKEIYTGLFQKSLYTIGKQWEQNNLSVADEHAASHITEQLIDVCLTKVNHVKKNGKNAVVACIDKEYHELGAKMVCHILELNGWNTYFLGASTPTRDLIKFLKDKKPDIVGLSFNFYLNLLKLGEVLDKINKFFPGQKILLGGQGIGEINKDFFAKYTDIYFINSLNDLDTFLKNGISKK